VSIPALLLTGGASSRMGAPKATLMVEGEAIATRAARLLTARCDPVFEVGPGYTSLPTVEEDPPRQGPLAALVAGADALAGPGPLLLVACDLPFLSARLIDRLVDAPGAGAVVPVDREGIAQPVCARYSDAALDRARTLVAAGERSMRALLRDTEVTYLDDVDERDLTDVDTPEDAHRWGIERPGSLEP
jgi:molybdenum cofactor guanylyltransferase